MEIQYSKMVLYGLIRALFYIVLPIVLIYVLSIFDVITFSLSFIISLLVIGSIGVILTILKHMYPKDTIKNRAISFSVAIYQGIYLFYVFGGFTPGVKLGTYFINTAQAQVILGLQLIAWLLLGIAGVSAMQYLIKIMELKKQKEYRLKGKKQYRMSRLFKKIGLLLNLFMIGYILSIVFSGLNVQFNIHDLRPKDVGWNNGGTVIDPMDDTINITIYFDVKNIGLYSIQDVYLDGEIFTETTLNSFILPEYTKIGEIKDVYFEKFRFLAITSNQTITVNIDPTYVPGLATVDADLRLKISLKSYYAGILINLNTSIITTWDALI